MAKIRVHELARELGMKSKDLLAELEKHGEFVRSASSTLEPPTERAMRAKLRQQGFGTALAPRVMNPETTDTQPGGTTPGTVTPGSATSTSARPGGARPGSNPYAPSQGMPRAGGPRPGNNSFARSEIFRGTAGVLSPVETASPILPSAPSPNPSQMPKHSPITPAVNYEDTMNTVDNQVTLVGLFNGILAPALDAYITRVLSDHLAEHDPEAADWTVLVKQYDESNNRAKDKYNRMDPQLQMLFLTRPSITKHHQAHWYPFEKVLKELDKAYLTQLRVEARNTFAHNNPISDETTIHAFYIAERLLRDIGDHAAAEEVVKHKPSVIAQPERLESVNVDDAAVSAMRAELDRLKSITEALAEQTEAFADQLVSAKKETQASSEQIQQPETTSAPRDINERITGTWNNHNVNIKRNWGGHRFTDDEVAALMQGKLIRFTGISKTGKEFAVSGKLSLRKSEFHDGTESIKPQFRPVGFRDDGTWIDEKPVSPSPTGRDHSISSDQAERRLDSRFVPSPSTQSPSFAVPTNIEPSPSPAAPLRPTVPGGTATNAAPRLDGPQPNSGMTPVAIPETLAPKPRHKPRVHELAHELGMKSTDLLKVLAAKGEFVKSASSVLEPPVERKIREQHASGTLVVPVDQELPQRHGHFHQASPISLPGYDQADFDFMSDDEIWDAIDESGIEGVTPDDLR